MILYRIAKCSYVEDLSGTGARLYGGRWNSMGVAAVYLSSSLSLAVLEVLVHLPPLMLPDNFCVVEIDVPDGSAIEITDDQLPDNWKDISPPTSLKKLGDRFLRDQQSLMLKLPSAIVPLENNYLLNPLHPEIKRVKIVNKVQFDFDSRLIKK